MATLIERLPLPERRGEIVDDCGRLLDSEVKKKKGMSGLAVKAGFKVLKAIKPGAVREAVDGLLDDFLTELDSYHGDWDKDGAKGSFGSFMKARTGAIAESLVGVTDRKAENTKHKNLAKMYKKLRPSAVRHVEEAVPGLADLMDKYYQA
jgi:hypothetical protein